MAPTLELQRIAAAYPPEARHVPAYERETHMTETQQLAWLLRFDPEAAAEVLSAISAATSEGTSGDAAPSLSFPHSIPHRLQPPLTTGDQK